MSVSDLNNYQHYYIIYFITLFETRETVKTRFTDTIIYI